MVNCFSKRNNKPKPTSPGYYRCNFCNKKVPTIIIVFIGKKTKKKSSIDCSR